MSEAVTADDRTDELGTDTDDDAVASILTHGDPIRSLARLPAALVEEHRLHVDQDGLSFRAVDPVNVGMVDVTAYAEGFERFDVEREFTFGLNLARFRDAVEWARKRGEDGDPVSIEVFDDPARMRVQVTRPDQQTVRRTEWFGIDPESIRQEPDVPNLDLPNRATPDVTALDDAVRAYDENHAHVTRDGSTFLISTHGTESLTGDDDDDFSESLMFPNSAWDVRDESEAEPTSSIFSVDYLEDMVRAIRKSKADRVTVKWGDEFPTMLVFEHEEWGFEGRFMLAPRISGADE